MKHYELIKLYPGSPKLGYISKSQPNEENIIYWMHQYIDVTPYLGKYWEEVIPDSFEVLSLISGDEINPVEFKSLMVEGGKVKFSDTYSTPNYWARCFCNNGWRINSVKRLKDYAIFEVGKSTELGIIKEIVLEDGEIYLVTDSEDYPEYLTSILSSFKKISEPLFETEDGYKIHEGDEFFVVPKKNLLKDARVIKTVAPHFTNKPDNYVRFKNLKAAEDFCKDRVKNFSLGDIKDAFQKHKDVTEVFRYLENLSAQRLWGDSSPNVINKIVEQ